MKRILCLVWIAAFGLVLCGCAAGNVSEAEKGGGQGKIEFSQGQLYAVAYLGYQDMGEIDYYVEQYLANGDLPIHYVSSGDYYLVIPRYTDMKMELCVNDIETSYQTLIFEDPACGPFVIQCNASDIFTDATMRFEYGGESCEFSPFISLNDGSLDVGERGLNITK